jgi:hypothetical protein
VTVPAESARFPKSLMIAGTADSRLGSVMTPSINPPTSPVMGSVSTPCGLGIGSGSGMGAASTNGAAAARNIAERMMRKEKEE